MPTWEEIAIFFDVDIATIKRRFQHDKKFKQAADRGFTEGKLSLRRWQMQAAEKGNPALLIFLGKNFLGQKDQVDQVVTGKMTQTFTLLPPREYARISEASAIPEAVSFDVPREEIRINGSDHESGQDVLSNGVASGTSH